MKLLILVLLLSVDIITGQNDTTTEETTTVTTTEPPTTTVTTTTTASTTAGSTETTSAETTATSTVTTEPTGFTSNSSSSGETTEPLTSEATSSTGSTATTTASTVTTVQPIGQQNFSCVDGNVTRFSLVGSFALAITYNTTKSGVQTVQINVPETANSKLRCNGNSSTESIQFQFFSGWSIELVFAEELSLAGQVGVSSKYFVSNITVTYVHDDHLPDSATPAVAVQVPWAAPKEYLATSGDQFYSCKSEVKQSLNGQVEVRTTNFKYKAFNEEGGIDWNSGSINECSADEETSSVVPIAVGAALAALVVIVLIAYLIGRRRARKTGYESV